MCLAAVVFFCFYGTAIAAVYTKKAVVMGTDFEVTMRSRDEASAQAAFEMAVSEMSRVETEMSEWIDGSPVSEINRNAGKSPVKVPEELFGVISAAQTVSDVSGGAFDITWAGMRGVWDFSRGRERVPPEDEVKKKLPLVDYRNVVLDSVNKTVFLKKEGMAIGLGAIAKGYAVDRAAKVIVDAGINDVIVKAGGDMRVQGTDESGPWMIGIRHPRKKEKLLARLPLKDISISTSGDYERYFIKDGVLYHHILDPKTGYPAKKSMSVTIMAPDTMTSDALSTAVFVLGPEDGLKLVERLKGVECVIMDAHGAVTASRGIDMRPH